MPVRLGAILDRPTRIPSRYRLQESTSTRNGVTPLVQDAETDGWAIHDPDNVSRMIHERAGNPDLDPAKNFNGFAKAQFKKQKSNLSSIIEIESTYAESQFLIDKKEAIANLRLISEHEFLGSWKPKRITSRDSLAMHQGIWDPPHMRILAQVRSIKTTIADIAGLGEIAIQVASHTARQRQQRQRNILSGVRVFIGHGHSSVWRELKDFIEDQLELPLDEFNRVSAAGMATTDRLSAMLDSSVVAFLVLTGEDEQSNGELRARENVVHEAGLFQGRLGFERAIVLLEEGCEKFSNIAGLVHISFPKNSIRSAFQDVREVLEREGVLNKGPTP